MTPQPAWPDPAPDALLGRADALATLRAALRQPTPALVSLVGAPGAGKTRLARGLATELHEAGVRVAWADLSAARDLDDVLARLAAAAGASLQAPDRAPAIEALRRALTAAAPTLVVLDDADRVTSAVSELLTAWRRTPGGSPAVLVTARERLRLEAEQVVRVPPLALPEAVALLRRGARALVADWDAAGAEAEALAALAERLDRLPLALELAAARLPILGPAALLARLDERLDALVNRRRDATARHESLPAALELSWERLSPDEQATLSQLALFEGAFEAGVAEAVVDGVDDVALALAGLVDRSLVTAERGRLRILRTVRTWVRSRAPAEADAVARYHQRVVALASETLRANAGDRLPALRALRDDLEAVWGARPDQWPAIALALDVPGRQDEAASRRIARLEQALGACDGEATRRAVALALGEALRGAGRLDEVAALLASLPDAPEALLLAARAALDRGRLADVTTIAQRGLAAGPPAAVGAGLEQALGSALLYTGRPREACEAYERSLGLARQAGDLDAEAAAHGNLGVALQHRDPARAAEHLERALTLADRLGAPRLAATAHTVLGILAGAQADWDAAARHYHAALAAHRACGHPRDVAIVWTNVVELEQARGRLDAAHEAVGQATAAAREADATHVAAVVAAQAGRLALEAGELAEAARLLDRARADLEGVGDRVHAAVAAGYRALVAALLGHLEPAREGIAAARRVLTSSGAPLLLPLPELLEACLLALEADAAALAGLTERARDTLERARGALGGGGGGTDGVVLRRVLAQLVARVERRQPAAGVELVIGPGAAWFRLAETPAVDLSTRPTLARVLDALADRDAPVDSLTLFALAWPGEVAERESAMERVRAAIAALRRAGLRDVLVRDRDGYLLAPDVAVVRWSAP